ncbi:carboxylesterase family protein [Hymenobacter terrenus]|uniref:carboxylesterase family protein n=1 Tax=Hymenobacter terrenus TaxID=1629124 RepID=UPI000697AFD8|nr:dienelactone hydrolase family protein [Hymenobacter terrenus]
MISRQPTCGAASGLGYLYAEPATEPPPAGWPLVVFLHGSGERGNVPEAVAAYGLPAYVAAGQELPFALASPQCPAATRWEPHLPALAALIGELCANRPIDATRVYVTGLSMGEQGAWQLAARYPALLAAAVPICGRGCPDEAAQLRHLPVWVFHGLDDALVPAAEIEGMVAALQAGGAAPRLTLYPGVGHFDVWDRAYAEPELWPWLLAHKRRSAVGE